MDNSQTYLISCKGCLFLLVHPEQLIRSNLWRGKMTLWLPSQKNSVEVFGKPITAHNLGCFFHLNCLFWAIQNKMKMIIWEVESGCMPLTIFLVRILSHNCHIRWLWRMSAAEESRFTNTLPGLCAFINVVCVIKILLVLIDSPFTKNLVAMLSEWPEQEV